jgi:hypothetical protein
MQGKYDLKFPIEVGGKTVTSVTIRRPKGRDMVAIGDHVATLGRFYAANSKVFAEATQKAIAAGIAAAAEGASAPPVDALGDVDATLLTPPDAAVYAAMVAVAAQICDLGDAAGDLDAVDLSQIATRALDPGEL